MACRGPSVTCVATLRGLNLVTARSAAVPQPPCPGRGELGTRIALASGAPRRLAALPYFGLSSGTDPGGQARARPCQWNHRIQVKIM